MEIPINLRDAQRQACKASIQIEGLTGSGKSGLALELAYILAGDDWAKVGAIDTENRSLDLYCGLPTTIKDVDFGAFKVADLDDATGYKPSFYIAIRDKIIDAGCTVCIKDSISHAWQHRGGVLDMVNQASKNSSNNDKYAAWRDEGVSTEKNNLLPLVRSAKCHVITTVRVKEKMEYVDKASGVGKELKSLGEQQIQQAELKYEPDLVLHTLEPADTTGETLKYAKAKVIKSRYAILKQGQIYDFTPALYRQIRDYLAEGVDPKVLLDQQKSDYIAGVTAVLDGSKTKLTLWNALKADAGFKDTKLKDLPLDTIKRLYLELSD